MEEQKEIEQMKQTHHMADKQHNILLRRKKTQGMTARESSTERDAKKKDSI